MRRVVILGRGGAGKSVLARQLSELTGIPAIELDGLFWQPGSAPTPAEVWVARQRELVARADQRGDHRERGVALGDAKVIASLAAAVLLAAFAVIEARSRHALLPVRVLRSRDRSGAYLISLCVGTAMFGMFFFLTLFLQEVWGYSPLKSGIAYLPIMATVMAMSGVAAQLVPRIGARPLLTGGSVVAAGGLFWLSRLSEHSSYAGGMLGPMMVTAAGIGLMFVPMSLVSLTNCAAARRTATRSLPGSPAAFSCRR